MVMLKNKLKSGQLTIGSWITIGDPIIAEIMANAGFEWLTVDMEHSAITIHQAQQLIQVIELCGVVPLVRVGENNPTLIKRVMDSGSHGVIVPMVNTKEDAIKAVNAVKYPPWGNRGVGLFRAQGYGQKFNRYVEWSKDNTIVIVQIEHIHAIENLESIITVAGVDGLLTGPYDLSGSLGRPGNFDHPDFESALGEVRRVCSKLGFPMGSHVVSTDSELVVQKIDEGYSIIAYGVDFLFLGETCRQGLQNIKNKFDKENNKGNG
jgi:2-dehydro-3-deoxyglucarate aldolase